MTPTPETERRRPALVLVFTLYQIALLTVIGIVLVCGLVVWMTTTAAYQATAVDQLEAIRLQAAFLKETVDAHVRVVEADNAAFLFYAAGGLRATRDPEQTVSGPLPRPTATTDDAMSANPPCPLCAALPSMVEGPLHDGGYYCACCGRVFHVDPVGAVVKVEETRPSPFRQAINNRPLVKPGGL